MTDKYYCFRNYQPTRIIRVSFFLSFFVALSIFTPTYLAAAYIDPASGSPLPQTVLRGFKAPKEKWGPGHRGVDLELEVGARVRAAGAGSVSFVGVVAGKPVVSITHKDGIRTTYQPVHATVAEGDIVSEGDFIGRLGHTVDGFPGLHWGAKTGPDSYIDPLSLLDMPVIRLKPLEG